MASDGALSRPITGIRSMLKGHWHWLAPIVAFAVGIPLTVGVGAVLAGPAAEDPGVIGDWNSTISKLGIDPVFPPEEDIHVGDLFAVITGDRTTGNDQTAPQALLHRSVKLAHLDMTDDLKRTYAMLPMFPDTTPHPDSDREYWKQADSKTGLFEHAAARPILALAGFPGFTIKHDRSGGSGFGAGALGFFGFGRSSRDVEELRIPFAETYGIPTLLATGRLTEYCTDPFTAYVCADTTLRRHLSYIVGPKVWKKRDPTDADYLMEVEIVLVNRAYLTRSIEHLRRVETGEEAVGRIATKIRDTANLVAAVDAHAPAATAQGQTDLAAAAKLDVLKEQISKLLPAEPGGAVSATRLSDSAYEFKQTFQRPVVIGYRAVRYLPERIATPTLQDRIARLTEVQALAVTRAMDAVLATRPSKVQDFLKSLDPKSDRLKDGSVARQFLTSWITIDSPGDATRKQWSDAIEKISQ